MTLIREQPFKCQARVPARGDIKLAEVLADIEGVSLSGWRKAVEKCHLDIDFYVHQFWDTSERLPWAILDLGTELSHLELELNRAMSQTTSIS